jgi:hypothetical protein
MVLSKIIFVVLLDFLAVATVSGWNHVSRNKFQSIVNDNNVALVACKSPKQILMSTEVSRLTKVTSSNMITL